MQIPAIKIAKSRGWKVICADGNSEAEGRSHCDYFYPIDLKDKGRLLELANEIKKTVGLDGVMTVGTDFSTSVSWITDHLNLPGHSYSACEKASNKNLMRQSFKKHGVNSPGFLKVNKYEDSWNDLFQLNFPVVVKPADNMGARGVVRVNSLSGLSQAIRKAFLFTRLDYVLVEEFITGQEYSLDALVYDNKIRVCGFADRHIFFPPFFIELGHTMPSIASENIKKEVILTFKKGIKSLGLTHGAAKGDIKYSEGKGVVVEIAARLSGGFMSGWTFPMSTDFSLIGAALDLSVGINPSDWTPKYIRSTSEKAFFSIPGTVKSIKYPEIDNNVCLFPRWKEFDSVSFPENNVEKGGNYIVSGNSYEKSEQLSSDLVAGTIITLEPLHPKTMFFLKRNQKWFFPEWKPENIQLICKMSFYNYDEVSNEKMFIHIKPIIYNIESEKNPQGRTAGDIFNILYEKYNLSEEEEASVILGRLYYKILSEGGLQGCLWLFDSIVCLQNNPVKLKEFLEDWQE